MSDDFSFFDDPIDSISNDTPAEPAPSAEPAPTPAPEPSVSPEQFAEVQRQLEAEKKWKQDLGRFVLGQTGQQPQQADPTAVLQELLADPVKFQQQTVQEAVQLAQQQMEQQSIIADRKAKHPELAKVEHLIDWGSVMQTAGQQFQQKNGRQPSFAEALDESIALVKGNIQGISPGSQANSQADAAKRMTLNLDLGGGQSHSQQPLDLSKIPDSDWPKYRDELLRRSQGY